VPTIKVGDFVRINSPAISFDPLPAGSEVRRVVIKGTTFDCLFMPVTLPVADLVGEQAPPDFDASTHIGGLPSPTIELSADYLGKVTAVDANGHAFVEFRIPLSTHWS